LDRWLQILATFDLDCRNAICLGDLDEVRIYHLRRRVTLLVEELLPLSYHPEEAVIEYHNFHWNLVLHDCAEFLESHLETAIADHSDNFFLRYREFRAHRCRKGKSHRSCSTGSDIRTRPLVFVIPRRCHLMLTDVGNYDSFTIRESREVINYFSHLEVIFWVIKFPVRDLFIFNLV